MGKQVILTGIRANNDLHLGNYLGALLPMVKMQQKYAGEYQINLFVPDLHSFTTPIDHSKLYEQSLHNIRLFMAAGLDIANPDTFIYRQSFVPAHSELTVILNCFTYMGELSRMTQFKEKALIEDTVEELLAVDEEVTQKYGFTPGRIEKAKTNLAIFRSQNRQISVGLFDYPVLMTSDILLYNATYVPVGADQTQHVELARDIAIRMNNKFGDLFTLPEAEKEQIAFTNQTERLRIRDLQKPEKKMSKSDESGKGIIFLGDTPEVAAKKVMSATTDSLENIQYDYDNQPGISNLLDLLAILTDCDLQEVIAEYKGQTQYGPLKKAVADAVSTFLTNFQAKLAGVDESALLAKLTSSEEAMNKTANETLLRVQKAVGLRQ